MDKLTKVRAEVERLHNEYRNKKGALYFRKALRTVLFIIDSLPEKQIWHEGNEEPKDNSKAIVCQTSDNSKTVLTMEYHKSDKLFHIKSPLGNDYSIGLNYPHLRWAYPEDLLPNK